jgi:H+/Cl- antiporter ClcA
VQATTPPRRLLLLTVIGAVLGVGGGGAAWVLLHLIGAITNVALFHRWGWTAPSFRTLDASPQLYVGAVVGAVIISLLAKWSPVIRGHGIPEAMEAILTKQSRIAPSTAVAKPISAAIAIGSGAPFGAEGPIIVTGGALGSLLGQVIKVSPSERKILLASGAAAGMAATFGAPLASVVLAIELLLFELSPRAFVPLAVASSVAGGMHNLLFGGGPLFEVPAHDYAGLDVLPAFVLLGIGCGLLAVLITSVLFKIEELYRKLPVSEFWHPIIGAVIFISVGLLNTRALGVGYDAIGDVLAGRLAIAAVASLCAVKLVAWWFALASGTSGGTLAPMLLVSAGFGTVAGSFLNHVLPGHEVALGAFAVVAMAATFGAATRATFTSMVFVFELTRDYDVVLPLMLATVVADLVYTALSEESIMTEKLARRGMRIGRRYAIDPFTTAHVDSIMSTPVETIPVTATLGEARVQFRATQHGAYPLVDADGALAGIVTRGDLLRDDAPEDDPVIDHATTEVVWVAPRDAAMTALQVMLDEKVEHVPVVSGGEMVGIVTRSDLLKIRQSQLDLEAHQPGFDARRLLRRRPIS